jgi:hypothetical protein
MGMSTASLEGGEADVLFADAGRLDRLGLGPALESIEEAEDDDDDAVDGDQPPQQQ